MLSTPVHPYTTGTCGFFHVVPFLCCIFPPCVCGCFCRIVPVDPVWLPASPACSQMLADHLLYVTTHYNHLESAPGVLDYPPPRQVIHKPWLPSRLQVNLPDNLMQLRHHTVR